MTTEQTSPGVPATIVPVPAEQVVDLRGRRAIVGEAGKGWRGELRTDQPDTPDGVPASHVPVLTEVDFYRAELDQIEVFAPLVPIQQVWIEQPEPGPVWPGAVDPARGRTSLDAPPVRHPSPAVATTPLTGRRVAVMSGGGARRDLRAVSEPYRDRSGGDSVNVCPERDWYAWALTGRVPEVETYPADLVWAE
ncbi:MAG TPA: hypothetical protein VFZ32_09435 [Micromonosporaceae bacterium]